MKNLEIEWLSDESDCDLCGFMFADGARVKIDGQIVFEFIPHARCYDGESMSQDEVYKKIFELIGYQLVTRHGDEQ